MTIVKVLRNNFITNFVKKPRVRAGSLALLKVISTFGIAYGVSLHTREQWKYAFKNIKPVDRDTVAKVDKLANKLLKFSALMPEGVKKCEEVELRQKVYQSFMEVQSLQRVEGNFQQVEAGPITKELFGCEFMYQVGDEENVTYIVPLKELGVGSFNKASLAVDVLNGKIRVLRELIELEFPQESLDLEYDIQEELARQNPKLASRMVRILARKDRLALLTFANFGDLETKLKDEAFSAEQRKTTLLEIFKYMIPMHRAGYVLGDLKVDNILLKTNKQEELKVKVADFGGACKIDQEGEALTFTAVYSAPEVFTSFTLTQATDAWALGLIMYQMKYSFFSLSGEPQENPNVQHILPDFILEADALFRGGPYEEGPLQAYNKIKDAFELGEEEERGFIPYLNMEDPYDQIIAGLLQFNSNDRLPLQEALDQLENISENSFLHL